MARTVVNKTTLLGSYPSLPIAADSADLTMTALTGSSGSSGNYILFGDFGRLLVVVQNTHATNPYTILFSSVANSALGNRTGDIGAYTLAAGDIAVFIFERAGWYQADASLYLESNNAAIKVGVVGL